MRTASFKRVINQPTNPANRSHCKHEGDIRNIQHKGERTSQLVTRCSPARHSALYDMLHINRPVFHVNRPGTLQVNFRSRQYLKYLFVNRRRLKLTVPFAGYFELLFGQYGVVRFLAGPVLLDFTQISFVIRIYELLIPPNEHSKIGYQRNKVTVFCRNKDHRQFNIIG